MSCTSDPLHGTAVDVDRPILGDGVATSTSYLFKGLSFNPGARIEIQALLPNNTFKKVGSTVVTSNPGPDTGGSLPPLFTWETRAGFDTTGNSATWPIAGLMKYRVLENGTPLDTGLTDAQGGGTLQNQQPLAGVADVPLHYFSKKEADPFTGISFQGKNSFLSARLTPPGGGDQYYGITDPNGQVKTLSQFKAKYPQTLASITAPYFNDGDLGFGRRMECWVTSTSAEFNLVCGVGNYLDNTATREQNAQFAKDDNKGKYLALVAMVWSSLPNKDVTFWVFDKNGNRISRAALDGAFNGTTRKADEKDVPGLCLNCHGGGLTGTNGNNSTGAMFLPFDVASFKYPQSTGLDADLQENFHILNWWVAVAGAADGRAPLVDLITGWYNHDGGTINTQNQTFSAAYTPPGWNNSPQEAQLYHQVFAPYCRTCHTALDGFRQTRNIPYDTFAKFSAAGPRIDSLVCGTAGIDLVMPHAQRAFENFWKNGRSAFMGIDFSILRDGSTARKCQFNALNN